MKKGIAFLLAMMTVAMGAYAQSTVSVEVSNLSIKFIYDNPDVSEATIAGTFNSWNPTATPMVKNADGKWEYVLTGVKVSDEVKFKFLGDGEWDQDSYKAAPGSADDGFGGLNGYIRVSDLVGGGGGDGFKPDFRFGTFASLRSRTNFRTVGFTDASEKGFSLEDSGVMFKWYAKFTARPFEALEMFAELAMVDNGYLGLYAKQFDGTETTTWQQGWFNTVNFFFHPWSALKGTPELGHIKTTLYTPYVNIFTANRWAKATIDDGDSLDFLYATLKEDNSNAGIVEMTNPESYNLTEALTLDWLFAPNLRDDKYGVYGWVAVAGDLGGGLMLDSRLQFGSKSLLTGTTKAPADMYNLFQGASYIVIPAVEITMGNITSTTQALVGLFDPDGAGDLGFLPLHNTTAITTAFSMTKLADILAIDAEIQWDGDNAGSMYGDDTADERLKAGSMFVAFDVSADLGSMSVGIETDYKMDNELKDDTNFYANFKPMFGIDLSETSSLDVYAKIGVNLYDSLGGTPLGVQLNQVGARYIQDSLTLYLSAKNEFNSNAQISNLLWDANLVNISAMAEYGLESVGFVGTAQAGAIYRMGLETLSTPIANLNAVGFFLGYNTILETDGYFPGPVFFTRFSYNFEPYDDTDKEPLKFDDYAPDNAAANTGKSSLTIGVKWEF